MFHVPAHKQANPAAKPGQIVNLGATRTHVVGGDPLPQPFANEEQIARLVRSYTPNTLSKPGQISPAALLRFRVTLDYGQQYGTAYVRARTARDALDLAERLAPNAVPCSSSIAVDQSGPVDFVGPDFWTY